MPVLVSLHDVTPAHRARLDRAEALLQAAGVERATYLIVPEYHRGSAISTDSAFIEWCRRPRTFDVEWVQHGHYHLEFPADADATGGIARWWSRRMMTAGEGEFLALDAEAQRDRLIRGREAVRAATGVVPRAFVAPAWLFNASLRPTLRSLGFRYTEDHWRIIDVQRGCDARCPAVTWATRTLIRRVGSRVVCPVSCAIARRLGFFRLAIHPFDLDFPETADQIRTLLTTTLRTTRAVGYDEVFAGR